MGLAGHRSSFFVYTGDRGDGRPVVLYLPDPRPVEPPAEQARFWVGAYWGTFTVGRVLFGLIANRFPAHKLLRISMLCATVAAGLLWWNPDSAGGLSGAGVSGFDAGPHLSALHHRHPATGRPATWRPMPPVFRSVRPGWGLRCLPWLFGVTAARAIRVGDHGAGPGGRQPCCYSC